MPLEQLGGRVISRSGRHSCRLARAWSCDALRHALLVDGYEYVAGVPGDVSSSGQQLVRALRCEAAHGTRHREDLTASDKSRFDGMHRTSAPSRLDDNNDLRERGDDPVAEREPPGLGARAQGSLGGERACTRDAIGEMAVPTRVVHVDAASDYARWSGTPRRDRSEGTFVRRGVDPGCQAGDHADACLSEASAELRGNLGAVVGGAPGADDRGRRTLAHTQLSAKEDHFRWLMVAQEAGRVALLPPAKDSDPALPKSQPALLDVDSPGSMRPLGGNLSSVLGTRPGIAWFAAAVPSRERPHRVERVAHAGARLDQLLPDLQRLTLVKEHGQPLWGHQRQCRHRCRVLGVVLFPAADAGSSRSGGGGGGGESVRRPHAAHLPPLSKSWRPALISSAVAAASGVTSPALPARSSSVLATRLTRLRPRALRSPLSIRRSRSRCACRDNGATSFKQCAGMEELVGYPRALDSARAVATRSATTTEVSPAAPPNSSGVVGRPTDTWRSKRSSKGAERRRRYRSIWWIAQLHSPRSPIPPHGHGFIAATSRNEAGNSTVARARATRTTRSSSGWRSVSSTEG